MTASRLGLIVLLLFVSTALCYTSVQVGVNSNFLVAEGKVYFAQSDGTLTVLNLETGDVVARNTNIKYGGTLQVVDNGILVHTYDQLTVLDKCTLEIIWQVKDEYNPMIEGDRLVSVDGNGLVRCRDLTTGTAIWSYDLPGDLQLVIQKGKLLVFRDVLFDGPESIPAVVLLDMASGEELLHHTAPPSVHYLGAFFDGEKIYLPSGHYKGEYIHNLTDFDSGRPSARFERMLVLDLEGNELASTPVSDGEIKTPDGEDAIEFGDNVLARNRVWKSIDDIPAWREGLGRELSRELSEDHMKQVSVTSFNFSNANVSITVTANYGSRFDRDLKRSVEVALKSERENWKGFLPYLETSGKVVAVELTEKLLLLGTDLGYVEAVDRATGQSKWMYIFPTMRHTTSYSTYAMPPMMASASKTYEKENKHKRPESGLILAGRDTPSTPQVSFDPEPTNPYRRLPLYLAIAWAGVLIPIGLSGLVVRLAKKRNWTARIPAVITLMLAMAAVATFFFYGRVSIPTAFGFRGAIAVPLIVAVIFALKTIKEKHWICGGLVLILALALGVFVFPAFLRL